MGLVPCPPEKYSAQTEVSQPMGCAHTKIMRPWFVRNLYFSGAGYELIPGGRISLYPWVVRNKNYETCVCDEYIFFRGRVRVDPRRQDQLVPMGCAQAQTEVSQPMGCAHTKIMRPWFVRNLYFSGVGYELIPEGRISSYPWVV